MFFRNDPELTHHCPKAIILVGTKLDLRDDLDVTEQLGKREMEVVSYEKGLNMANSIKAVAYIECSSKTRKGVSTVFMEAIRVAVCSNGNKTKRAMNSSCNVM